MDESTPKKPRQTSLISFVESPAQGSPSEASPSHASPSIVSPSGKRLLLATESSHKKLRSIPAYRSEEQVRDFYRRLEAERIRQLEAREERGDSKLNGVLIESWLFGLRFFFDSSFFFLPFSVLLSFVFFFRSPPRTLLSIAPFIDPGAPQGGFPLRDRKVIKIKGFVI